MPTLICVKCPLINRILRDEEKLLARAERAATRNLLIFAHLTLLAYSRMIFMSFNEICNHLKQIKEEILNV